MAQSSLTPITLPADPVSALQAATKQYVDNSITAATPTSGVLYASGTAVTVSNTVTETDILGAPTSGITIPGGTLGTNTAVKIRIGGKYLNNSGSAKSFTLNIYYGGTKIYSGTTGSLTTSGFYHAFDLECALQGAGATNAQTLSGTASMSAAVTGGTGLGSLSTIPTATTGSSPPAIYNDGIAIDSTLNQTLRVTITHSAAASTVIFTSGYASAALEGVGQKGATWASQSYITGLELQYVSGGATLNIGEGECWLFDDGTGNAGVFGTTGAGITGVTPAASSALNHVYVYNSGGGLAAEMSTTGPAKQFGSAATKSGDVTRRYIGSVYVGASLVTQPFQHNASDGLINYMAQSGASPFRVLSGGAATTSTSVSCSTTAPAGQATHIIARILQLGTPQAYINNSAFGAVSSTNYCITCRPSTEQMGDIPLDSSAAFQYYNFSTGGNLFFDTLGVRFER